MSSSRRPAQKTWHPWQLQELVSHRAEPTGTAAAATDNEAQDPAREQAQAYALARKNGYAEGERLGREAGYQAGLAQGLSEGKQEGLAAAQREAEQLLSETLAPMRQLIENAQAALGDLEDAVATDLVDLALTVGRQLARSTLDARPEELMTIVRELLQDEQGFNKQPKLILNPEDLPLIQKAMGEELSASGWQLQADDNIRRGGCKLVSPCGELDATWEARCQNVADQLRGRTRQGDNGDTQGGGQQAEAAPAGEAQQP